MKKVTILGFGKTGKALLDFLLKNKYQIFVSEIDKNKKNELSRYKNIKFEVGRHSKKIYDSDIIIVSPGIKYEDFKVTKKFISEIDFAIKNFKSLPTTIGITGTNGKTTTVNLIYEILKNSHKKVVLAGNIGSTLIENLDNINSQTIVILELSSYQLELSNNIHCKVAAFLNFAFDHIEYHKSLEKYFLAKTKIFQNQTAADFSLLNYDYPKIRDLKKRLKTNIVFFSTKTKLSQGIYLDKNKIIVRFSNYNYQFNFPTYLKGIHNIENCMVAIASCLIAGAKKENISKTLQTFKTLPHRLETFAYKDGIEFINDSKSTNIHSTKTAIKSLEGDIILILGGRNKGEDFSNLNESINSKIKVILAIGESQTKILTELGESLPVVPCENIKNAVKVSKLWIDNLKNIKILLSPACSSFDQFKNFEERGEYFKKIVKRIFKI